MVAECSQVCTIERSCKHIIICVRHASTYITPHISLSKAKPALLHSLRRNTDRIIQHATTDTSSTQERSPVRILSYTNTTDTVSILFTIPATFHSHSNEPQTETDKQTNKDKLTDIRRASRQCSADVIPHNRCQNNNTLRNQTSVISLRHHDSEQETGQHTRPFVSRHVTQWSTEHVRHLRQRQAHTCDRDIGGFRGPGS